MKTRYLPMILALIVLLTAAFAGCDAAPAQDETVPSETVETEAESKPHSVIPKDAADQPEWTLTEADLSLCDAESTYAEADDFLYFAIVGSSADDMELRFKLDEDIAAVLSEQPADNQYYIALDGESIGTCTLGDDFSVATIKGQHTYMELTDLATRIRGLSED